MKLQITSDAYTKLWYFIRECDSEITGFGKVRKQTIDDEDILEIYDIEIFQQEVSGTHATLDDEALATFLADKVRNGEDIASYRVWWHSHVNMEAFFSSIDTGTIELSREFPYLISIVGNKPGQFKSRIDIFQPLRFTQDLTLEISDDENLLEWVKEEIAQKVEQRVIPLSGLTGQHTWHVPDDA